MKRSGVGVFGISSHKPTLEIKPDSPFVVLYGEGSESETAELTGQLVLTNYESMTVRSIKMIFIGTRRTSWTPTNIPAPNPVVTKGTIYWDDLNLWPADGSKNRTHKINPGTHIWNFKFKIPTMIAESVEGLGGNWIVYNLEATIDRGLLARDLTSTKHIRIVRTLGQDMWETMPSEQINEDIWASKLAYKVTVPQKNYIVGTSVTADFMLIPLRKGVEISTIRMDLIEQRVLYGEIGNRRISHSYDHKVAEMEGQMPPNCTHTVSQDPEDADQMLDEAHRFKMTLDLPKSLKQCRQSVDTEYIRITHKLRIYVNIHNPEGHTSQLLVKNHLHLFISPNLPPNEDQSVRVDEAILSQQAIRDEAAQNAPPTYGRHTLDELFSDIDPSGFMTPGGRGTSGSNTPFYDHSRSGSYEDLRALEGFTHHTQRDASISVLHSRLHNLTLNESPQNEHISPAQHSSGGSTPGDSQHGSSTPGGYFAGVEYDMDALVRTPSYNTAVRTPLRHPSEDLPSYEIATSRPTSPLLHPHSNHTTTPPNEPRLQDFRLDPLAVETQRNTALNSRRASPSRADANAAWADEQSSRNDSISTATSTLSSSASDTAPSTSSSTSSSTRSSLSAGSASTAGGRERKVSFSTNVSDQRPALKRGRSEGSGGRNGDGDGGFGAVETATALATSTATVHSFTLSIEPPSPVLKPVIDGGGKKDGGFKGLGSGVFGLGIRRGRRGTG